MTHFQQSLWNLFFHLLEGNKYQDCTMPLNFRLFAFVTAGILILLCSGAADAKACKVQKSSSAWKHSGGMFRKRAPGSLEWVEYDNNGKPGSDFVEETREGDQIVVTNHQRGISILLRHDLAGIRNKGEHQFQQLYQGHWMRVADCT